MRNFVQYKSSSKAYIALLPLTFKTMTSTIFSMLIFALVGAITPGPVNIIATSTGASFGFRRTLYFVLGATISYTSIVFLVGSGLNIVLQTYPQITQGLQYVGGAFLLFMSYKIAFSSLPEKSSNTAINISQPPAFIEGVLAQSLNPKAWLVSMSGVSLYVSSHPDASLALLIFCIISFFVCFGGVASWAALGHTISRVLSNKKYQRLFNIIMGLLLSATVVLMFTTKL